MKNFFKFILLAQTASDAGKGYDSSNATNAKNAIEQNYDLKDKYITQCLSLLKNNKDIQKNVKFNLTSDINMSVVIFDIKGYGQISFHSYSSFESYKKLSIPELKWNGIFGGSLITCKKIAKLNNLPYYKHK